MDEIAEIDDLNDFPVAEYYKDKIREARTISRNGSWWSALLLIEDPKSDKLFLNLYRWKRKDGAWKVSKSFSCRSKGDARKIIKFIEELSIELK